MPVVGKRPRRPTGNSTELKAEALSLAEQVGVGGAAKRLGLHESQLYAWRKKARYEASRSETEKDLVILKKGRRIIRKKPAVKYAFMHGNTGEFSIKAQSEDFGGVSRSGNYAWRHRRYNTSRRQMKREKLDNLVAQAFEARKERSGAVV